MRFIRDNRGLTLVELLVTIAIGSIITLAATTILLLGLRIYKQSNDDITRQNQVRVGMAVMEELVTENPITKAEAGQVWSTQEEPLLSYNEESGKILTGTGGQVMENVKKFEAKLEGELLTLTVKLKDAEEEYTSVIRCPVTEPAETGSAGTEPTLTEGDAVTAMSFDELTTEELLAEATENRDTSPNVRAFLKTLASQLGSTGRILTEDGEGEYYSEWYIGSYEDHPGWNEDTPWCACFVSWALEECSGYLQGQTPRFANVDTFWAEFVTSDQWKTAEPEAGDIVFFDWLVDDERNPQHVGVVLAESEGWLYTIEGNSVGTVAIRRYPADDDRILAYGTLNWA